MPHDAKSHLAGPATHDDGTRTTAYRAVADWTCSQCGRVIRPGELFSRHTPRTSPVGMRRVATCPICITCWPFHLNSDM